MALEQLFTHSFELAELTANILDTERVDDTKEDDAPELDYIVGYKYPIIKILNSIIQEPEVISCEIDSYGKIPKLTLRLRVINSHEIALNIIKDKEIISLFMRSGNNNLSHIRSDFFITEFDKTDKGDQAEILIESELNIPKLYADLNDGYNGSSIDILQLIAKDLKLGFVTNIDATDDSMIWIATNQTYYQFIDYVVRHSWIDDETFLDWYIDVYNNLVFYDVNQTLIYEEEETRAIKNNLFTKESVTTMEEDFQSFEWNNIFSDVSNIIPTDHGYKNLRFINNTKLSKMGYVTEIILLDYEDLTLYRFDAEAIADTTQGVPLKSRLDDDSYREEKRIKYLGIQNDNMHSNYLYAELHNFINNLELDKINIEITSNDLNLNYTRGSNVFLQVTDKRLPDGDAETIENFMNNGRVVDLKHPSNNYKVHGMKYGYKKGVRYCKYLLTRREWALNEEIE